MKTAQEIASKIENPDRRGKTPVGKAQETVFSALGIKAGSFSHGRRIENALGIVISHRREGRKSVPVVHLDDRHAGGFNIHGEGEEGYSVDVDLSPIAQWMAE